MSLAASSFKKTPFAVALMMLGTLPLDSRAGESAVDAAAVEPMRLEEVRVRGTRQNDYNVSRSSVGAKTDAALRDIPQTVNVISRAVMDAQAAATLTDALRNVPGITLQAGEGGAIGDNVNLRGLTARTDIYLDGARDRGQYKRDTFELESVEVLKGPSSLFFGRGSTGGVINQVTKVPTLRSAYNISGSIGTDGYYRSTVDLDQKLDEHAAFRLNAFAQDVSSTREVVENKDFGLAPALRFGIGEATEVTLSGLLQRNHDIPDYGIPFLNGQPAPISPDRFYGDTDDFYRQSANVFRARIDQTLTPWLSLRNQMVASETDIAARPTPYRVCTRAIAQAAAPCPVAAPGTALNAITLQSDRRDREVDDNSIFDQLDFIAKFDTGRIGHQLIAGAEVGRDTTKNQGWTNTPRELASLGNFVPGPTPANTLRTRNASFSRGNGDTLGLYLNETAAPTRQLKLVGGLRWDQFDASTQTINNSDGRVTVTAGVPQNFQRRDYFPSVRGGVVWQPNTQQSYYVS
jgi:catecholate siderophore receptor